MAAQAPTAARRLLQARHTLAELRDPEIPTVGILELDGDTGDAAQREAATADVAAGE